MVAVPSDTPVIVPVDVVVATAVLPELHVPPATASLRCVVNPVHIDAAPAIVPVAGVVFTVTTTTLVNVPQVRVTV